MINPTNAEIDFSIHLQSATDPLEMLDLFIKKWLPSYYAHLSDTDDNDGEYLRQAIQRLNQEAQLRGRIKQQLENYKGLIEIGIARQPGEGKYDSVKRYLESSIAQLQLLQKQGQDG